MVNANALLLVFAVAFMGCVFATPAVTRLAFWTGAIDRPDQFRRIHKGATPRLGGLALAFGLLGGVLVVVLGGYLDAWPDLARWCADERPVIGAGLIVLLLGFVDDTRGVGPRVKLLIQAAAVGVLYLGGVRIENIDVLGWVVDFSRPALALPLPAGIEPIALPSLAVTTLWFLGCMNIWNLIDGMDGLASGVGLLVSGTLTLVAIHHDNHGVALTGAALAGGLAGFLLYNWHPACIFLGDSGSLLIGLLIGVMGVQGSFKASSSISILFPILAMGLPISDTALAIFRRWVRNLPLSAADRRHVHHLLISLGLDPRQAALLLYCFSGFLCGAVLLGVALKNEELALILGLSGCLAFLLVVTSRLNELSNLRGDVRARLSRGRQERFAAQSTWEAIQRVELCKSPDDVCAIVAATARVLGCDVSSLIGRTRAGLPVLDVAWDGVGEGPPVSGCRAEFRITCGGELRLTLAASQAAEAPLAADIAFRSLQRLAQAVSERLEWLLAESTPEEAVAAVAEVVAPRFREDQAGAPRPVLGSHGGRAARSRVGWVRVALGLAAPAVTRPSTLGEE